MIAEYTDDLYEQMERRLQVVQEEAERLRNALVALNGASSNGHSQDNAAVTIINGSAGNGGNARGRPTSGSRNGKAFAVTEKAVLRELRRQGPTTARALAERFGVGTHVVLNRLHRAQEAGLVERNGTRRRTRWSVK